MAAVVNQQQPTQQYYVPQSPTYQYSFLENQLIEAVKCSLRNELYQNASFLCERLYAEVKNEDVKLLLAECYLGEGKAYKAYEVLKDCQYNANRYKFAITCLKLNKLVEAEKALLNRRTAKLLHSQDANLQNQIPNGAAGLYLLGQICERQIKRKEAVDYYTKALMLDPTLWCAFERLCRLQMNIDPSKIFNENHNSIQKMSYAIREYMSQTQQIMNNQIQVQASPSQNLQKSPFIVQKTPTPNYEMKENLSARKAGGGQQLNLTNEDINNDDDSFYSELKNPSGQGYEQYVTPKSNMNHVQAKKHGQNAPVQQTHHVSRINISNESASYTNTNLNLNQQQQYQNQSIDEGMQPPISSIIYPSNFIGDPIVRPFSINTPNLQNIQGTNLHMNNYQNVQSTPISSGQQQQQQQQQVSSFDNSEDKNKSYLSNSSSNQKLQNKDKIQTQQYTLQNLTQSTTVVDIQDLMNLLKVLGQAYLQLCLYKCTEGIKIFSKLSKKQYNTGWVLSQVGKCQFEMAKYQEAEKTYQKVLKFEPYRLEGLEYYSTCLWHLKKQVELCYLSNFALEKSLFAPETWCVVGNCYSLQKEHETALKFFNRAIQLNGSFAYAHTLSGHEYVANEDFDQAKKCYQRALTADERHYNAWWGLGNICLKQEKFEQAAQFFNSAIQINPKSSVLLTYLGMTKHNCNQPIDALKCFEHAESLDPLNPLNKYQKATVLTSLERYEEALKVLEDLLIQVPKEAPIYIVIGKIYKKLGNIEKAHQHFTKALDLDPKDTNMVKSLIDKIHSQSDINDDADIQII